MIYFTSDWHLHHEKAIRYRTRFKSVQEHDQTLIDNYMKQVKADDTVYFLGDICNNQKSLEMIRHLHGTKLLVMGNWDSLKASQLLTAFTDIVAPSVKDRIWISHQPIHPKELNDFPNIHGHTHQKNILNVVNKPDNRYYNVSPEQHNYYPVAFELIKNHLSSAGTYFRN